MNNSKSTFITDSPACIAVGTQAGSTGHGRTSLLLKNGHVVVLLTVRRCAFSDNSERFGVRGNGSYRRTAHLPIPGIRYRCFPGVAFLKSNHGPGQQ